MKAVSPPVAPFRKPTPAEIQDAIARIERFWPSPRILGRALVLLRDMQCDVVNVAELIRGDPALTSEVLRISNSVFFRGAEPVTNVEDALQRIGYQQAQQIVAVAVSRIVTLGNLDNYCIPAEDFWGESLFHGVFMEQLAITTGAADPGMAYVSGLLRYIGRLAIDRSITAAGGGLFWLGHEPLTQWERDNVGLTHAEAGAMLLRRWRFPDELVEACAGQEQPALLPTRHWLASALYFTESVLPQEFNKPFAPVLGALADSDFLHPNGLTVPMVEQVFAHAIAHYEIVRESLG